MKQPSLIDRRGLGRALTRLMNASAEEAVLGFSESPVKSARRIGFTGPPGVGKSTLVSRYAKQQIGRDKTVGVLAIDPTSPISGGALLGDRIRMDAIANDPRLYIRSIPSRDAQDGLCPNVPDLLLAMDHFGFDNVILETVGVGQVDSAVKSVVDTVVLVLMPQCGDAVQAMKAGIIESADILVINKADLPNAAQTRAELAAVMETRPRNDGDWTPPLILTSSVDESGLETLDDAINKHQEWRLKTLDPVATEAQRRAFHLNNLVMRRAQEVIKYQNGQGTDGTLRNQYLGLLQKMAQNCR